MVVEMLANLGTPLGRFAAGEVYEVEMCYGVPWIDAGYAVESDKPVPHVSRLLARLDDGAGRPCLFMPFLGEFGHLIMSHVRMVHFHRASLKIVCCRPGEEVLFPSAGGFVTDWPDPLTDIDRVGTDREPRAWPALAHKAAGLHHVPAGNLTLEQEMHAIEPATRIPFRPKLRGLRADVVIGVRNRTFAPEKNWRHWQVVADALTAAGLTFAVVGARDTSADLIGQRCHSGDYDTDAAIELLQHCRLYVGTDSGATHLASTVGASMLVFRENVTRMRDFIPRMMKVNPGRIERVEGWDDPAGVAGRVVRKAGE